MNIVVWDLMTNHVPQGPKVQCAFAIHILWLWQEKEIGVQYGCHGLYSNCDVHAMTQVLFLNTYHGGCDKNLPSKSLC